MAQTSGGRRAVVLHCTAIVYFLAAFFTATFGAVQPGSEWLSQAAYALAGLATLYGAVKGVAILRRDLRRRALIRNSQPRIYDMASYLGGHPSLPKRGRVLALLTGEQLVLDSGNASVVVPVSSTRLALRHRQTPDAPGRAWRVAHNDYGERPSDAVDVEFLDERGHPQRLTLARFRRTSAAQWDAALADAATGAASATITVP